jgi:hypothetical protein
MRKKRNIHGDNSEMVTPEKREINDIRLGRIFRQRTLPKQFKHI